MSKNRNNLDLILALSGSSGGGGGGSEANANIANSFSTGTDYVAGDYVIYGENLYKFVQDKAAGAWDPSVVESATVGADLSRKLNVDGYSALATVGNAEQLVSTVRVTDDAPYLFRTAGGAADIGNREYDKIVGGTVAHNQLVRNGNFTEGESGNQYWSDNAGSLVVTDGTAKYTITSVNTGPIGNSIRASSNIGWYKAHKYLFALTHRESKGDGTQANSGLIRFTYLAGNKGLWRYTNTAWQRDYAVYVPLSADSDPAYDANWYSIRLDDTTASPRAVDDWFEVKNVVLIDLTQMFGSTIADHIYELENDEAGSGVEWLRTYGFLALPYYPRTAGVLASVEATAHETVGFNAWDEEWERGTINNDGTTGASTVTIRSKNFSPCIPGQNYCFTKPANINFQIFWYDANQAFIKRNYFEVAAYAVYTVPDDAAYFKITFGNSSNPITAYANNICVNISWSGYRNGEYEPYVKHSYPLDALTLRGVPMLDVDGGLDYDGDTYAADGTVERKYGVVDLGSLTWTYLTDAGNGQSYFLSDVRGVMKPPASNDDVAAILPSSGLTPITGATMYDSYPDRTIAIQSMDGTASQGHLWIRWSSLSDPADLVAALSGVMLVYPLAEPTTEEAEPFQSPQIVDDFGTERYIVTPQDGFEMPVGHITEYPANLRDKLQHLPDLAENDGAYAIQQTGTQMTLTPLASAVPSIYDLLDSNPIAHRTIYRGKNLGSTFTAAQKATIAAGEFHDIWLGDYWVINSVTYVVVDFDYWYNCGDTAFTKHHIVVMPKKNMYNAQMNATNITTGGYYGSAMRGADVEGTFTPYAQGCGLYNALTAFQTAFGDALLTHREYLSNAVTSGKVSGGAWYDSIVELPGEIMMYGVSIRAASPRYYTIDKSQLALMQVSSKFITINENCWLRDVVSDPGYAFVGYDGRANDRGASASFGVRPVAAIGG